MDDFIKFSDFQKTVNFTPIKMWRTFNKLRDAEILQHEIDWRLEGGSLYVVPSRLYVEARKLRPEIEYVSGKSNEINETKMKSDGSVEASEESNETISNGGKPKSNEFIRNQMKTNENESEVVALLKEQIEGLKTDKKYLQDQVGVKSEEVANANKERAFLMRNWQDLVQENDVLRRQLTSGRGEIEVKSEEVEQQENVPAQKLESEGGEAVEVIHHTTPPQSPQIEHHEDLESEDVYSPIFRIKTAHRGKFWGGRGDTTTARLRRRRGSCPHDFCLGNWYT